MTLKFMLCLCYEDGKSEEIVSDESWKVRPGACKLTNVYGSEIYDAREYPSGWDTNAYRDGEWDCAVKGKGPKGELCAQGQPPIVVKKSFEAKLIDQQADGYLYDLGQNMSCLLELAVKGKAGEAVELWVAEKLDAEGKLDQMAKNWNLIDVACTYILSGAPEGECWKQEFSYVGARYVLVKGAAPAGAESSELPELRSLKGHYIVSESPLAGTFSCDDERYNRVYSLIAEAMDSNLKSVHTDCPSIEKTAWLEESHLLAPSIMFYRDVRDLWEKIFDDAVRDQYTAQTWENGIMGEPVFRGAGFLPPIAPSYGKLIVDTPMGNFWDLIAWSSFPILGADWYYRYECCKHWRTILLTKVADSEISVIPSGNFRFRHRLRSCIKDEIPWYNSKRVFLMKLGFLWDATREQVKKMPRQRFIDMKTPSLIQFNDLRRLAGRGVS